MSTGLFQRLFAAAEGSLGAARVRPQAARAWSGPDLAAEGEERPALVASEPMRRGDAGEPPPLASTPASPPQQPAAAPARVQAVRGVARPDAPLRPAAPAAMEAKPTLAHDTSVPDPTPAALAWPTAPQAMPERLQLRAAPLWAGEAGNADNGTADPSAAAPPPLLPPAHPNAARDTPAPTRTAPHRASAPAASGTTTADGEATVVHVSIGRVEFLPAAQAQPPRARAAQRATPRVALADYLGGKAR